MIFLNSIREKTKTKKLISPYFPGTNLDPLRTVPLVDCLSWIFNSNWFTESQHQIAQKCLKKEEVRIIIKNRLILEKLNKLENIEVKR